MSRADEKRAFEAMMAEISDSDSEDEAPPPRAGAGGPGKAAIGIGSYSSSTPSAAAAAKVAAGASQARPNSGASSSSFISSSSGGGSYKRQQMSKEEEEIERFAADVSRQPVTQQQTDQYNTMKRWLLKPCTPDDPPVQCYVERHREGFGRLHPTYKCFLEPTDSQGARFLMSAKKKAGSKTSYYLVSLDQEPSEDRGSEAVLGKIRGNTVGSQYLITDHGLAPEKTVAPSMLRRELGLVRFEFDSGGPSHIEAFVPAVNSAGVACIWQPNSEDSGIEKKVDAHETDKLLPMMNKKPKWDDAHGGHVLNFQGRVTESSVKNFQLCLSDTCMDIGVPPDDVLMQFGRVAKNKFTLDVKYPLSPMQAFSLAVACMDGKLADRKGYEYFRKLTGTDADDADDNSQAKGSVTGSHSFAGTFKQAMPSTQYLKDKINRAFK